MAIRLPTATRNAMANQIRTLADADAGGAGQIRIYTGSQPASANDAASGTLLATFNLAKPSFADAVNGTIAVDADPVLQTTGVAAGTAGWYRILDFSGDTVMDGSIPDNLTMNTTTVSVGLTLRITGGGFTAPAG